MSDPMIPPQLAAKILNGLSDPPEPDPTWETAALLRAARDAGQPFLLNREQVGHLADLIEREWAL